MDRCGIGVAFVSLVDGAFLLNPGEANERITHLVARHRDRLLPVGTLNASLPGWRDDALDGVERLNLAGFRLHPTYHGYALDSPEAVAVAETLAEYQRPLFVAAFIDEERFQHPVIRVPPVLVAHMANLIRQAPQTTFVLNNLKVEEAITLLGESDLSLDKVYMDVNAMDIPFNGLAQLVERYGSDRLAYGSQVPFLYPEASLALVQESAIPPAAAEAILEQNWRANAVLRSLVAGAAH
jgi:predicted TIM-barrel fold metal-dependent hydrolase